MLSKVSLVTAVVLATRMPLAVEPMSRMSFTIRRPSTEPEPVTVTTEVPATAAVTTVASMALPAPMSVTRSVMVMLSEYEPASRRTMSPVEAKLIARETPPTTAAPDEGTWISPNLVTTRPLRAALVMCWLLRGAMANWPARSSAPIGVPSTLDARASSVKPVGTETRSKSMPTPLNALAPRLKDALLVSSESATPPSVQAMRLASTVISERSPRSSIALRTWAMVLSRMAAPACARMALRHDRFCRMPVVAPSMVFARTVAVAPATALISIARMSSVLCASCAAPSLPESRKNTLFMTVAEVAVSMRTAMRGAAIDSAGSRLSWMRKPLNAPLVTRTCWPPTTVGDALKSRIASTPRTPLPAIAAFGPSTEMFLAIVSFSE